MGTEEKAFIVPADQIHRADPVEAEASKESTEQKQFITEADSVGSYTPRSLKLTKSALTPQIVDVAPKSIGQLILFELPIVFHIPLFFIYNLTLAQQLDVMLNAVISLILGLVCFDLLDRMKKKKRKEEPISNSGNKFHSYRHITTRPSHYLVYRLEHTRISCV